MHLTALTRSAPRCCSISLIDRRRANPSEGADQTLLLNLNSTQITDTGLAHLKGITKPLLPQPRRHEGHRRRAGASQGLTKLSFLGLERTKVTDAGLVHLKGLTKLTHLNLSRTQVTDAGMEELKRALPNLSIEPLIPFPSSRLGIVPVASSGAGAESIVPRLAVRTN